MITLNYQVSERGERARRCVLMIHPGSNIITACDNPFRRGTRYEPRLGLYEIPLRTADRAHVEAFVAEHAETLAELVADLEWEQFSRKQLHSESSITEIARTYLAQAKNAAIADLPRRKRTKQLKTAVHNALGRADMKAAKRLRQTAEPLLIAAAQRDPA